MITGHSRIFRDDQPDQAATHAHAFGVGAKITVFRLLLPTRPLIEGRAEIIAPVTRAAHLYKVRFEGERRAQIRFVHPGDWQNAPERQLAALLAHWRATLTPDILTRFDRDAR